MENIWWLCGECNCENRYMYLCIEVHGCVEGRCMFVKRNVTARKEP